MVRYADDPATQAEVHIAAPPGAVWPLVSDIALPARLSTELMATIGSTARRGRAPVPVSVAAASTPSWGPGRRSARWSRATSPGPSAGW